MHLDSHNCSASRYSGWEQLGASPAYHHIAIECQHFSTVSLLSERLYSVSLPEGVGQETAPLQTLEASKWLTSSEKAPTHTHKNKQVFSLGSCLRHKFLKNTFTCKPYWGDSLFARGTWTVVCNHQCNEKQLFVFRLSSSLSSSFTLLCPHFILPLTTPPTHTHTHPVKHLYNVCVIMCAS